MANSTDRMKTENLLGLSAPIAALSAHQLYVKWYVDVFDPTRKNLIIPAEQGRTGRSWHGKLSKKKKRKRARGLLVQRIALMLFKCNKFCSRSNWKFLIPCQSLSYLGNRWLARWNIAIKSVEVVTLKTSKSSKLNAVQGPDLRRQLHFWALIFEMLDFFQK